MPIKSHNNSQLHSLTVPHGILLINKPKGWRSFDVVRYFQRIASMKKIGHSGTLDEQATGLMILAFGRDTAVLSSLLTYPKTYIFRMIFGAGSDTLDQAGTNWAFSSVPRGLIQKKTLKDLIRDKFMGTIDQEPPIFSCLKVKGKRLHEYARNQQKVEIPFRKITIHSFQLIDLVEHGYYPQATFEVACSSGTYIRSLARDIGANFGVHAHLADLCRTSIGSYHFSQAVSPKSMTSIEEIKSRRIIPVSFPPTSS